MFNNKKHTYNMALLSVVASLLLLSGIEPLFAQTTFQWPDSRIVISDYQYIDNCISLHSRVLDSVRSREVDLIDTIPNHRAAQIQLSENDLRPKVAESMAECLAKFRPTDIPREYTLLAQVAFLNARRFDDANAVVHHGVSFIERNDTAASYLLDSAVLKYTRAAPFQADASLAYMERLNSLGSVYRDFYKLRAYTWIMIAASSNGEMDDIARRAANKVLEIAPLAVKESSAPETFAISIGVGLALRFLHKGELIDSLRVSTDAYANLVRSHFKEVLGFVPQDIIAGSDAPTLEGDFWYPASAFSRSYPSQGKLSMVVFIPSTANLVSNIDQLTKITVIRRLSERYPDMELVFSSSTVGFFGPLEPPGSDREARMIDSLMRVHYGIKNILTVTRGSFIQLDAPDSRRVYQSYPNSDAYPPVNTPSTGKMLEIYLVDENRKIVEKVSPGLGGEGWIIQLIDALRERNGLTAIRR